LADFIQSLPTEADELRRLPGTLEYKNDRAFAYTFAMERAFSVLELSVLYEPPVIFLDDDSVARWASAMSESQADQDTFAHHVLDYREHFHNLAMAGAKASRIVLVKETMYRSLYAKSRVQARFIVKGMIDLLSGSPSYELVILDIPNVRQELEIVSAYRTIPSALTGTESISIAQSPLSAKRSEFSVDPFLATMAGLQRDISQVDQCWAVALDQYRQLYPSGLRSAPNSGTLIALHEVLKELG
jgi:hypothetical protein